MTWGEACGALKKCWTGYRIAVNKGEYDNIQTYAGRINSIQKHMGIPVTWFEELDPDGDVIDRDTDIIPTLIDQEGNEQDLSAF